MGRTPAAEIIKQTVLKFPDAPARQLARMIYKDNHALWSSEAACLTSVRAQLGVAGQGNRKAYKAVAVRPKRKGGHWMDKLPKPLKRFDSAEPVPMTASRVLVLSDIHYPYHDEQALKVALQYGLDHGANGVLLNGDITDAHAISHWSTDPRERDFPGEIEGLKELLSAIREGFPKAEIVYKPGNHEARWDLYLRAKAPELLGLPDFEMKSIFGLDKLKISLVPDMRRVTLGKLNVIHGHEYRFAISNPVNPARGLFLRAKSFALCGHHHQSSTHQGKSLDGHVVRTWSTGCLCQLQAEFSPYNEWSHGFAFVQVEKDGAFSVDNKQIIKGRAY